MSDEAARIHATGNGGATRLGDLGHAPERAIYLPWDALYGAPAEEREAYHLAGLQTRFEQLAEKIPLIRKLAAEQGLDRIATIEDAGKLLLPHSDYKSYPLSVLENGRYDRLTRWLDNLTVHDLSGIDATGCETIDEWVELLDRETPIRLVSSSGTSGKLSIVPRSEAEGPLAAEAFRVMEIGFGEEEDAGREGLDKVPVFACSHTPMPLNMKRYRDNLVRYLYDGDGAMVVLPNPRPLSLEAVSMAGRILAAQSRGEAGESRLTPHMLRCRDSLIAEEAAIPEMMERFFQEVLPGYAGRQMRVLGTWPQVFDMTLQGESFGASAIFAPDTMITMGGGTKGRDFPPDYRERIARFFGLARPISTLYAFSETLENSRICPAGHYHVLPYWVPFLLDPKSGEQLPRSGTQTGRFGVFDLAAMTYWGGFLSGDRLTISWGDSEPCPCGRNGPYIHTDIRRFTEQEGGDDKIVCSGAPAAHDKALAFLEGRT